MAKGDIKLSKKYGVNPAIPSCFWCGKQKNEIVLFGHIGGKNEDIEAKNGCFIDYEPCDQCNANWMLGTTVIEVDFSPNIENQPPIQKDCYPTGRLVVLKKEAGRRIFNTDSARVLVDREVFKNFENASVED